MNKMDVEPDIKSVLAIDDERSSGRFRRKHLYWGALALGILLLIILLLRGGSGTDVAEYTTHAVSEGALTVTVTATGTIEPRNEVNVGIEVSGTVSEVLVDYNDTVEEGDVLARLDTSILAAEVAQSQASLDLARAAKAEAEATLKQAESELARLMHVREISGGVTPSAQQIEEAEASRDKATAALASATAQIQQSKAQLTVNAIQLRKAEVISPIRGVVLSRLVDPGQTVAATLTTPELFVIAEDLSEMELNIEVDEADVGQVRDGQAASFTVDAYPDEEFPASITQLRYAPVSSDGVVTYEAILSVDNSDLRLRPGMTATAVITTQEISNALLVPNEALRFAPRQASEQDSESGGIMGALMPGPPNFDTEPAAQNVSGKERVLWVLNADGVPQSVSVRIGSSDGSFTQIESGELALGDRVITEQSDPK